MQTTAVHRRFPVEEEALNRCIAIALTQKRFMRSSLKQTIYEKGLYPDLHQELAAAAVEAWRLGYDPDIDFRLIKNLVQRRLYAFLKANGMQRHWDPVAKRQGKGFLSREVYLKPYKEEEVQFGDNEVLILWLKDVVVEKCGEDAWEDLMSWAHSDEPEPRGAAVKALQILKEVIKK